MAPSKTSTVKNKHASKRAPKGSGLANSKAASAKPVHDGIVKQKAQHKTGKGTGKPRGPKKQRQYSDAELGVPQLNTITPAGVEKPKQGKKGKVFVDDKESMLTILAMVHADKDGEMESKMMKSRQMEEIREARKAEQAKRVEVRKAKLDDAKESMRKKRKREKTGEEPVKEKPAAGTRPLKMSGKKSVSFA